MSLAPSRRTRAAVPWLALAVFLAWPGAPARAEMFFLTVTGTTGSAQSFKATIGIECPFPGMVWSFPSPYPGSVESVQVEVGGVTTFSLTNTFASTIQLQGTPLTSAAFDALGQTSASPLGFGSFDLELHDASGASTPRSLLGVSHFMPAPGSEFHWQTFGQPGSEQSATITGMQLVSEKTPEPGTLALLALGAAGLAGAGLRRRRRRA
jgi:hypothetical protein